MDGGKSLLNTSLQNKSVVEQIIDRIVSAIIEGELKPGDKLPTEMELCRDLGVGRNSVREAVKKLEALGVVHIKRADGTFVSETYTHQMLDPMLYGMILQNDSWQNLIELRRVLDIGTLYAVIGHSCTKEQFEVLWQDIALMESEIAKTHPSVAVLMDIDTRFHMHIAALTDNEQIINITDYIAKITIPSRRKTVKRVIESGGMEEFLTLHKQMVWVIEKQKYDRVGSVVMDHYVYWKEERGDVI